jgi:predicted RND superfamily exporter protein
MKKLNYTVLSLFALVFVSAFFTSCSKDSYAQLDPSSKLRDQLIVGKEYSKIQEDFEQLDRDVKVAVWNEKLDQILSLNLPAENKKFTNELKDELSKNEIDVTKISDIAQKLADITPEEDFEKMYTTLYDYKYNGKFIGKGKMSSENLEELKKVDYNYKSKSITQKLTTDTAPIDPVDPYACNCNWTCSWYRVKPTSNCGQTKSGCGFLWAFECTKGVRNEPVPYVPPIFIGKE